MMITTASRKAPGLVAYSAFALRTAFSVTDPSLRLVTVA